MGLTFEELTQVVRRRMRNVIYNAWWLRSPRINLHGFEFLKRGRTYRVYFCAKCGNYNADTASPLMAPASLMCFKRYQNDMCLSAPRWLMNATKSEPEADDSDNNDWYSYRS
jgi:hypothetical protein